MIKKEVKMKGRVLFTHSYFLQYDPKQWKQQQPYAPLATITAAALMRRQGYEVALHDSMFCAGPEEMIPVIEAAKPRYLVIYDDGFNYLTKMCLTNMREAAFRLIETGKQYGCKVIVSSSDATDHATQYLEKGADFIIIGEAEETLAELIDALETDNQAGSQIQGIAFLAESKLIKTPGRPVMKNPDELPFAAWDLIEVEKYRWHWMKKYGYFSINMATTRGCPYKCNWCAKPIYGNRYHSRSPENVVAELKALSHAFQFDHIWFCDDIFGLKPGWIARFGELLKQEKLSFRFKIQTRVDIMEKEAVAEALAAAGCDSIWMGVESGSQKILDAMDKGITISQIYKATRIIKKLGMKPAFFLQFGYPGENREDIRKTLDMLTDLMPDDIGVSVAYPLPGTGFYDKVKNELAAKANWTDSDDLALMFKNTYSAGFYKLLHRLIHKRFRKYQAINAIKGLLTLKVKADRINLYRAASAIYYFPAEIWAGIRLKMVNE